MAFNTSPFAPGFGHGIVLSATASSANAEINAQSQTLCLTNLGTDVCYIKLSETSTDAATTADYPVPGGAQVTISKNRDYSRIAYISAVGTSLHVMPGEGF